MNRFIGVLSVSLMLAASAVHAGPPAGNPAAAGAVHLAAHDADDYLLGHQPRERREKRRHPRQPGGIWLGVGTGILAGSVEYNCPSGECSESGVFSTYSANVTLAGPLALRVRGIRTTDREGERTPYELAGLVGGRFGRSPWYGLVGVGRVRHADDNVPEKTEGFAWEVLFAPRTEGPVGFELSFNGHSDSQVDFAGFNLGLRFGALPH